MRRYILTFLFLTTTFCVWADERTADEMAEIAQMQLNKGMTTGKRRAGDMAVNLLAETESYHIYGSNHVNGFVVVSRDDDFTPVLGYSESNFDKNDLPDGLAWWLQEIDRSLKWRKATGQNGTQVAFTPTPNFITTTWSQTSPYNNLCPMQNFRRTLTGCVATAIAQILNYYRYPKQSTGTGTYYLCDPESGDPLPSESDVKYYDAELNTEFQWDNMLDSYKTNMSGTTAQRTAVAQLMRDCGYATAMGYSYNFSGTNYYSAATGLTQHLGFDESYVAIGERDYYSDQEWMTIIYNELAAKRPILYSGTDPTSGGHSFIFSGIDADGKVYVNWGWNGQADGFYDISDMAPTNIQGNIGTDHFNTNNIIIYNLHPTPEESGMQPMAQSQFGLWSNSDEATTYSITASYFGNVNVSTDSYNTGVMNYHYLPFTGTIDLCVLDDNNQLVKQYTIANLTQEVDTYNGFRLYNKTVSLSSLADGTYTVFLGSQRTGDNLIAPVRCTGGPIVYTLKKQNGTVTLTNKREYIPTGIDNTISTISHTGPTRYYDLNGHQLTAPRKGVNIIRQNDGTVKKVIAK